MATPWYKRVEETTGSTCAFRKAYALTENNAYESSKQCRSNSEKNHILTDLYNPL